MTRATCLLTSLALVASCDRSTNPCDGQAGACIVFDVQGEVGDIDAIQLDLSGAVRKSFLSLPSVRPTPLPVAVGVLLPAEASGELKASAVAILGDTAVGLGSVTTVLAAGAKAKVVIAVQKVAGATCTDGYRDGKESDVDCGGAACAKCAEGRACREAGDCATNQCEGGLCGKPPAVCTDGQKNGAESDVDCGGALCPRCADGKACAQGSDCASAACAAGRCGATCTDGQKNGMESDVDCGGGTCPKCADGKICLASSDCSSNLCDKLLCAKPPGCTNAIKDGDETDVDCGGTCPRCADGKSCKAPGDCTSGLCKGQVCLMLPAGCANAQKDGDETDVDCGGSLCPKCAIAKGCLSTADCVTGDCTLGAAGKVCSLVPSCDKCMVSDGTKCVSATAGTDPRNECIADPAKCVADTCNGEGSCAALDDTACGSTTCKDTTTELRQACKAGACTPTPTPCKLGFACEGSACTSMCDAKKGTGCATTAYCDAMGQCQAKKANGKDCVVEVECMSGNCVDGKCCDKPASMCSGCKACNLAAAPGTCGSIAAGEDPHKACASDCADGACDGMGACKLKASGTPCGKDSCAGSDCLGQCKGAALAIAKCDGKSAICPAPTVTACASNLVCDAKAPLCLTMCAMTADCKAGFYCASGMCKEKLANGATCTAHEQCKSYVCSGGACIECRDNRDCSSERPKCSGGACGPCDAHTDCSAGTLGTACGRPILPQCYCVAASECINPRAKYCKSGTPASQCTCGDVGICPVGWECTDDTPKGTCKVGLGLPCTQASDCKSGKCMAGLCA